VRRLTSVSLRFAADVPSNPSPSRISGKLLHHAASRMSLLRKWSSAASHSHLAPSSLYRLQDTLGLPRFGWHRLRHTFATNYVRHGGDIVRLSIVLGHTQITTTQRYLHLVTADLPDAPASRRGWRSQFRL
jgi:integrase